MATLWISLFLIAGAGPTSEVDPPNFQSEAEAPIPAAPEVVKPSGTELSIVYTSRRGCFLGGSTHIDAIDLFKSVAEREKFSFEESSLGIGVYFKDGRYLIPEKNFADPTLVSRILSDKTPLERSVIESGVMLLESEFSAIVQFPRRERRDMLALIVDEKKREHGHNDMEQRQVDVVRYKSPLGSLVAIEPPGQLTPIDRDPLSWIIQPSLSIMAGDEDGESRVLFLGKRQGTPGRIKADFDERVARAKDPIRVYPGMTSISKEGKCGETLKAFGFDVLVPHRAELELGAKEFIAFQKKHQLNYTVSNLRLAKEKSLVAPRFVIKTLKGKNVVFVSVVPRSLYEVLPESAQRSFAFLDPWQSLQEALKSARERLGKKPDLVVAIASGNDAEAQQRLTEQLGVDIVMGNFSRWAELVGRTETARLSKEYGGREDLLLHRSSFVVRASPYSTGSLRVSFEQGRLSEIQNESRTSTQSGPNDEAFSRQRRAIARKEIEAEARVLFPDVMPIIKADDTLMSMATGERVLSHGIFKKIDESAPRFSDPVWMRMVTNIVREEMDADVAIISNLARGDNVIGPALRLVVRTWLPKQVEIERTTMTAHNCKRLPRD